jgi:hypothetical protein
MIDIGFSLSGQRKTDVDHCHPALSDGRRDRVYRSALYDVNSRRSQRKARFDRWVSGAGRRSCNSRCVADPFRMIANENADPAGNSHGLARSLQPWPGPTPSHDRERILPRFST